jgi:hypothetical protein
VPCVLSLVLELAKARPETAIAESASTASN